MRKNTGNGRQKGKKESADSCRCQRKTEMKKIEVIQLKYSTKKNIEQGGQVMYYKPDVIHELAEEKKRSNRVTAALLAMLIAVVIFAAVAIARASGEDLRYWVLCKSYVHLRMRPDKDSTEVGRLDCGESFLTDGEKRNGWIHVIDAGDCDCWVYSGYVVTEQPEAVFDNYICVANRQVACRRWVDGPRIDGRLGWLKNGNAVSVFWIAGDWALTSRGYIRTEWLEADPG